MSGINALGNTPEIASRMKAFEAGEMRKESVSGASELHDIVCAIKNEVPFVQIEKANNATFATRNDHLEGTIHPETEVPFQKNEVETSDGKTIEAVFPDFREHVKFEVKLPDDKLHANNSEQFKHCDQELHNAYNDGRIDKSQFTPEQCQQIENGDRPRGYSWHHHEEKGRMQLVDTDIHSQTGHTGGQEIWGGGGESR